MIDTLKLSLKEYVISGDSKLTIQPASYMAGSGEVLSEFPLFTDRGGRVFRGSKAYINTDHYNLTLQPFTRGESGMACFLQFSIPKVHHQGNNYFSVSEAGAKVVVDDIERELREAGINTPLQEANISRLDAFRNIAPDEPFSSYYGLFSLLKARRAIQRGYGTTFLVHNTQQQFVVYDKLVEMQSRGVDVTDYTNTMRFEHRLLNGNKVKSVYGFSSVSSLFSGGFDVIRSKERESWKKSLFSRSVEDVIVLGAQEIETELRHYKENYGKRYFVQFLRSYGAYHLAKYAGVDVVKVALQGLEASRLKVYRAEKLLNDTKAELDMLKRDAGSDKTLATLYRELQAKVLN